MTTVPGGESGAGEFQIIVPVYDEGDQVLILHRSLIDAAVPFDSLRFVYDRDEDTTLPFIEQLAREDSRVAGQKNTRGPGVVNALRHAFAASGPGPVLVMMGDLSDDLRVIAPAIEAWEKGATVVSPSRYMRGGRQEGGGLLKAGLSRLAGVSLRLVGFPTSDPTNNFKLYDGAWLGGQEIESDGGFEIALELTYKAWRQNRRVVQVPTLWKDRTDGESRFRLWKWLPHYLRWWFKALGACLTRPLWRRALA